MRRSDVSSQEPSSKTSSKTSSTTNGKTSSKASAPTTQARPGVAAKGTEQAKGLHDLIERRAYEIWLAQGRPHGHDVTHWLQAEGEVRAARSRQN